MREKDAVLDKFKAWMKKVKEQDMTIESLMLQI